MKIHRLARIFELKYGMVSLSSKDTLNQNKKDLINMYTLYVDSEKAKEPVLQILANIKEPFSLQMIHSMEELIANLNHLSAQSIFRRINGMLLSIKLMKNDPEKTVRNFIHDSIRANKESERNYREHLKSKFELIISRISSILEKQAKSLQSLIKLENPELKDLNIDGERVIPQHRELSKDKILNFIRTPAAQSYGLDSLDTMTQVLSYPDLRDKITVMINAIDRGHTPINGPEVKSEVEEIMKYFNDRQQTNLSALEKTKKEITSFKFLH